MDGAFQSMGVNTDGLGYGGGKLAAEIAGTAGAGSGIAGLLSKIPGLTAKAPALLAAIQSGGMSVGGATGKAALASRVAGGAITGGASAAAVNPEDAAMGAGIGAVAGPVVQGVGKIAQAIGTKLRGPEQPADLVGALLKARNAGYVVPPTQARPTTANRVIEGLSGKITTAQNASAANQGVRNQVAAKSLGLAPDTQLSPDVLSGIRTNAGKAYEAIGNTGTIVPVGSYTQALDDIAAPYLKASQGFPGAKPSPVIELVESLKSKGFDAAAAVEKIKQLRTAADDAFRSGNTDIARASKGGAKALEDAIEGHLQATGNQALLQEFRDARQLIAKTYTVAKALNPTTGSVDGRRLAAMLDKGKPMTGDLRDAAEFAQRFPKANQSVEGMGSLPQTSPLDFATAGGLSAATGNPAMLATLLARPAARKLALSPIVQNRLIQPPPTPDNALLRALLESSARAAPVIYAQ